MNLLLICPSSPSPSPSPSTVMLTQDILSIITPTKDMEEFTTQVSASAIDHALESRCSESEESSDDSYSSDDSVDEEEKIGKPIILSTTSKGPRRPTSLCINSTSDRRASAPSQRSPLSTTSIRSLSSYGAPASTSPRTPSMSMRHDAALRSFQQKRDQETHFIAKSIKPRPAMMDITSIAKVVAPPRIEIEQVFDDEEDDEEFEAKKREVESAKADRSAARKRMLSTLVGRGGQGKTPSAPIPSRKSGSRRVPSLDHISNLYHARGNLAEVKTPAPKTPGTASPFRHSRNASCPTPTSPYTHQYGNVQVIITPPTPRPQELSDSPLLGIRVNGIHGGSRFPSNDDGVHLLAPYFELAPGKQKAIQDQQTLAWIATLQAQQQQMEQLCQQQIILNSMQNNLPICYDFVSATNSSALGLTGIPSLNNISSPSIIPGTPGAPSMIHIQQQKAILAQQRALQMGFASPSIVHQSRPRNSNSKSSQRSPQSTAKESPASSKSWWRNTLADSSNSNLDDISSGSVYSKSSAAESSSWRRNNSPSPVSSEKSQFASPVYLIPAKRAAMSKQQQQ